MDEALKPGRRIWLIIDQPGYTPFKIGPLLIIGKKPRLFPAGVYERKGHMIDRKQSLLQIVTDPGGMRTVAAASIRFKDPGNVR